MTRPVTFTRSWAGALAGVPAGAIIVIDDWGLHITGIGQRSLAWEEITHVQLSGTRSATILGPEKLRIRVGAYCFIQGRRTILLIADRVEFTRL